MRVVPHAKNASQAATCERKRNPVIHGSVRCADGDGRLSTTKTYPSPRLVTRSHDAGHPTETHHAPGAGPISSRNLFSGRGTIVRNCQPGDVGSQLGSESENIYVHLLLHAHCFTPVEHAATHVSCRRWACKSGPQRTCRCCSSRATATRRNQTVAGEHCNLRLHECSSGNLPH